jgi:hypothetical protein
MREGGAAFTNGDVFVPGSLQRRRTSARNFFGFTESGAERKREMREGLLGFI